MHKVLERRDLMNCSKCGAPVPFGEDLCEKCANPLVDTTFGFDEPKPKAKENVLAGTVGALVGAVIGGGSIILLSQLGYIASISGLILAVCTLKGYELLGKRLSGLGIGICVALMLVTPYFADRLDWAIVIMQEFADYGVTFGEAYGLVPVFLEEEAIEMGQYIKNLLMIYGFVLLGAFSTIRSAVKK